MAAAINTSVAAVGNTVSSLTTGSVSPSGSDRVMFGVSVTGGASAPSTTDFKYGGSGGTALSALGATGGFAFGFGNFTTWKVIPGPSGSTTAYGAFGANNFPAIAALFLTGAHQTTPFGAEVTGSNTNFAAAPVTDSISLSGLAAGQMVVAAVSVNDIGGSGITSITAGANTTVEVSGLAAGGSTGEQRASIAILSGVADGSGNLTLNYTITMQGAGVNICWQHTAFPVADAAGGGPTYTLTADGATYSYSGTAVNLVAARILGASGGTYSYSGTAASLLRGFNLSAAGGTYTYTGTDATLTAGRVLVAGSGTYAYTGQAATLTYTPTSTYALTALGGTYSYSGTDISFLTNRVLDARSGAFAYSCADATLTYSGEPARRDSGGGGAPGGMLPYVAYINGKRVIGNYWQIKALVEELAEEEAEKVVVQDKPAKRIRIVVEAGKPVTRAEPAREVVAEVREVQTDIRQAYSAAYAKAKLKLEEEEEETMMVLL